MNSLTQFKKISILPFLIALMLVALAQNTQAVSPPPDGGYPGDNTAEGDNALFSLTTGTTTRPSVLHALYQQHHRRASTRPTVLMRSIATPPAATTRPTVCALRSIATPPARNNTATGVRCAR